MKKTKIEGTFYLEGLLEGPLPGGTETESKLMEWSSRTSQVGLPLSTEIDNGRFSILATSTALQCDMFQPSPQESVRLALQKLLEFFPPEYVTSMVSTIRIIEYIPNEEIQGLFSITPDGGVDYQHRRQPCQTIKPAEPISKKELIKTGIMGVVLFIVLLGISTFFIDYSSIWADLQQSFTPITTENTKASLGPFSEFYIISDLKYDARNGIMVFSVTPAANYPMTDEDFEKRWQNAKSLKESLTLQALRKGYALCEYFDKGGKYIGCGTVKLPEISEKMEIKIPMPKKHNPAKIMLTWPA